MNVHQVHQTSMAAMARSFTSHWNLIRQLTRRDVVGRYRGSVLGLAWSFVSPLIMLAIYTFVFSVVFRARWGGPADESTAGFALVLFSGLLVHAFFADCVSRAPTLVLNNANLVKKVVFPLEILPWSSMGSALFHAAASVAALLVAELAVTHTLPWTVVLLPLIFVPLVIGTMGVSWALAALGVYLRDITQVTGMVTSILLFLSPVFYPAVALDEPYRSWLYLNPLTPVIEDTRNAVMYGHPPPWGRWALGLVGSVVVAQAGFWFFQRTRRGFADVV